MVKVEEKENKVVFGKVADKGKLRIIGVSDASYNQEEQSVAGEIIMLGNKDGMNVLQIYWKSGIIRKEFTLPKAGETRGVMKIVDDGVNMTQ